MKKVKIVFWLLILALMGLLFYQNQAYFLAKSSLSIDLWLEKYLIPETANGIYFLACILIGFLMAYVYHLPERFRSGKAIKQLNATVASLKTETATLSRPPASPEPVSPSASTAGGTALPTDSKQAPPSTVEAAAPESEKKINPSQSS